MRIRLPKNYVFFLVGLVVLVVALGGWWYWTHRGPQLDSLAKKALENIETVTSYRQHVETETYIEDRHIKVVGDYTINETDKQFSSEAVTTLTLPDKTSHSFSLQTITLGDTLFAKVQSQSPALNLTVPSSPEWKSFNIQAIPDTYREIATPRPPMDNLALFKNAGTYLIIKESRVDEEKNGERLARYVFNLSSKAFTETTGPVSMIAERVGVHGTVEVWIRESDAQIRHLRYSNAPYISTTEFTQINAVPALASPLP